MGAIEVGRGLEHTFERKWNSIWKMAEEKRAEDENENTREIHAKAAMAKVKRRNCFSFLSFPSILNDERKKKEEESLFFLFFFFCPLSPRRKSEVFFFPFYVEFKLILCFPFFLALFCSFLLRSFFFS